MSKFAYESAGIAALNEKACAQTGKGVRERIFQGVVLEASLTKSRQPVCACQGLLVRYAALMYAPE